MLVISVFAGKIKKSMIIIIFNILLSIVSNFIIIVEWPKE